MFLSLTAAAAGQAADKFPALMDSVMHRMHQDMQVSYSGSADRDFAAMMIPHHRGAVEMATLELRFGKDERLRRIAQGIIVEQNQEIAALRERLEELDRRGE